MGIEEKETSLRGRLFARLLTPLCVVFVVSVVATYTLGLHYANQEYDAALYDALDSLADDVQVTDRGLVLDFPEAARRMFEWDRADKDYFKVEGESSGPIAGRRDLPPVPGDATQFLKGIMFDAIYLGQPVRVAALYLPKDKFRERVLVEVAETINKRQALAREILGRMLLPQILLLVIALVLVDRGVREGMRPLEGIAARLTGQKVNKLEPMPTVGVPKEIRPLTDALNNLLRRLEQVIATQRRFVADAAHQLRTPLTALSLHIERIAQEETLEDVRAGLQHLHGATERVTRLSRQLLTLARAESGPDTMRFESIDLSELAEETGADWVPRALEKKMDLSFVSGTLPIFVNGNPLLLREALNNLLDNAIKYGSDGGCIQLRVCNGADVELLVQDDGPGIPPDQWGQAFVRFHRGDRSNDEGSGLGLSIVQEIIQLHKGQVALDHGLNGRGLTVRITLPKPPEPSVRGNSNESGTKGKTTHA